MFVTQSLAPLEAFILVGEVLQIFACYTCRSEINASVEASL